MDPISQGVLGSVAALTLSRPHTARLAATAGWIGGMLADADVLIRSDSDPLLNVEFHRHFTHSLAFVPVGGLLAALLLWPFLGRRLPFPQLFLFATAGYATAGLLDACTSYGTQLLWPFSDLRVAWSIISIVDPVFTLPLLLLVGFAIAKKSPKFAWFAAVFAGAYLSFGILQHRRAAQGLRALAAERGHEDATRFTVKPSIANLVLWRSIYLNDGRYYVDAIRVGFFSDARIYGGSSTPAFDVVKALAGLQDEAALAEDLRRFDHFSEGYLAALPDDPDFITDLRYSAIPNSLDPLWGIDLSQRTASGHAVFETRRDIDARDRQHLVQMLKGVPVKN